MVTTGKIFVVGRTEPRVIRYRRRVLKDAAAAGIVLVESPEDADCIVVLGGDRTMLEAIHQYQSLGKPFLGINFGHKGFFMNEVRKDLIALLLGGYFKTFSFPLLSMEIHRKEEQLKDYAANDVYMKPFRSVGSCKVNIIVNGITFAQNVVGDGVVASTALGSTAYNLSAGGSAIMAGLEVITLTPICVHTPVQVKPTVWSRDTVIELEVLEPNRRRVVASCDGREYEDAERVIIKQSRKRFRLILLEGEGFTERLVTRIMKVQ